MKRLVIFGRKDGKPRAIHHIPSNSSNSSSDNTVIGTSNRGGLLYWMMMQTDHGWRIQTINEKRIREIAHV